MPAKVRRPDRVGRAASALAFGIGAAALVVASSQAMAGGPTSDWTTIDMGGDHSCGVKTSGRLFCWGSDNTGQLGDGDDDEADEPLPVEVSGAATDWIDVDAGEDHTCARKAAGTLFCWGSDASGQVGDGEDDDAPEHVPAQVGTASDWIELGIGDDTSCARRASKRLYCWGYGADGQIGDGAGGEQDEETPTRVLGRDWKQVTGGGDHICAINTDRRLFCWGWDGNGQLGDGGGFDERHGPTQVAGQAADWKQVAGGDSHTCAIKTTRKLLCWGRDANGEVGDGDDDEADEKRPVNVRGRNWKQLSEGGDDHQCALKRSGQLFCWGSDLRGQLGDGLAVANQFAPTQVTGAATDWIHVEVGDDHTCARKTTLQLFCWGRDASGQVGNGGESTADEPVPVEVGS